MNEVIVRCIEYVKNIFKNEYSGHDHFHTLRVYKMAKRIAIEENANLEIVSLAALLHDVDDIKLSPNTHKNKDNARKFLLDNNVKEIELICEIIGEISFKGIDTTAGKTLET